MEDQCHIDAEKLFIPYENEACFVSSSYFYREKNE